MQEVGTKATSPRGIFAKQLALMKTAAEDKAYGAANMNADKRLQFQNSLSDAEAEATTWSLADTERLTMQLEREIHGITSKKQRRFKKEYSIHLIEFEAWWETIDIQAPRKTIEQRIIHFGYPKLHLVSHISESIPQMGSGNNYTTDISEWLNIPNMKEAYQSSYEIYYIPQMRKHNDRCTGLDYMVETLSYLALEGWYEVDSANVFNLLSTPDKWQSTCRAYLLHLQTIQDEPFICPVSQQVYDLREMHIRGVCRNIKLTSLRGTSDDFGIPNFGQLFRAQIDEDCGSKVCGLVLQYDQNVLIDSIFI